MNIPGIIRALALLTLSAALAHAAQTAPPASQDKKTSPAKTDTGSAPKKTPAPKASAGPSSGLKKALEDDPNLVLDVLRHNKKEFFEVFKEAYQEDQMRQQREQAEAEKRELDESFKNPKKPEIDEKSHVRGENGAKYTLVEYSDFQCPYCSRGFNVVESLRQKYGSSLRFVYKNLPLPRHPEAMPAARYFEAAAMQSPEKAWAFHDKLFQNQDKLGEAFYKDTAKGLGLDVKKLEADAKSEAAESRIKSDMGEAQKFGFDGTPGFLLNGVPVHGAYPAEYFDSIIQKLDSPPKDQKN